MPSVVAGRLNDLPADMRMGLGSYRYDVFVRRLGWTLANEADSEPLEWDQFDDNPTVHVVALGAGHQVCGCARLLPTTGHYNRRGQFRQRKQAFRNVPKLRVASDRARLGIQ
ncbi:acyl-homoserine-lactone synthase [Paraburkholderia sp. BL10I2N1]|uniref:acyl-homoserine-lactone synthase n=1 Tax=Paraburkholderia sp. BL10I2N1 TaxID=1938796 RepID=UPI001061F7F3|nr:acyl-homoserine-lactone synthase [Paraburkholderia sp. BL10I2N1]TDN67159.1 autoinducer synthase [Paraburkholderia sp. BL10I2N1]